MKFDNVSFTGFLDLLLTDPEYKAFVDGLREKPKERYYEDDLWHSVQHLLRPYPEAASALHDYAFSRKDESMSFSAGNLKACYIIDEDIINNGRAFVLFNLVATSWFHVGSVSDQGGLWEVASS